jgi:hypothetical protein
MPRLTGGISHTIHAATSPSSKPDTLKDETHHLAIRFRIIDRAQS